MGEVGIVEVGEAEVGGVEVGGAEVGAAEVSPTEVGAVEASPAEVGLGEVGATEVGAVEASAAEAGAVEVGAAEVDATEVGAVEASVAEAGAVEVSLTEVGEAEVRSDVLMLAPPRIPRHDALLGYLLQDLEMLQVRHRACLLSGHSTSDNGHYGNQARQASLPLLITHDMFRMAWVLRQPARVGPALRRFGRLPYEWRVWGLDRGRTGRAGRGGPP